MGGLLEDQLGLCCSHIETGKHQSQMREQIIGGGTNRAVSARIVASYAGHLFGSDHAAAGYPI